MAARIGWEGVFPAVTTQFRDDLGLDIEATRRVMEALIRDGVSGLIVCGTVGENTALTRAEKVAVMEAAKDVLRQAERVLVLAADLQSSLSGPLAIGCLSSFAALVLPELRAVAHERVGRGFVSRHLRHCLAS